MALGIRARSPAWVESKLRCAGVRGWEETSDGTLEPALGGLGIPGLGIRMLVITHQLKNL